MKMYEVRIGSAEGQSIAPFQDRQYRKLSDAIRQLGRLIATVEKDKPLPDDDLGFWVTRISSKKGAPDTENNLIQLVCGVDEDTDDFCYEGIYYLSKCSDFERMILMGEKKGSWMGNYSVQIASEGVNEVCFFSDLEMIIESIRDLRQRPDQIRNRLMTISRKKNEKEDEPIAMILYTVNPDGSLKMQSRLCTTEKSTDTDKLLAFIREEQNEEHDEEPEKASPVKSVEAPEDIEGAEKSDIKPIKGIQPEDPEDVMKGKTGSKKDSEAKDDDRKSKENQPA